MALVLDSKMRQQNAAVIDLVDRLRTTGYALQDSAHTNVIALERLEEQDAVVKAAIAWEAASRAGPSGAFIAAASTLRALVQKHNAIVEARS